jgi:putative transposase
MNDLQRRDASRLYSNNILMPDLYKDKYRIPSARLQTWDYGDNGLYFVTICIANRECLFGEIVETPYFASSESNILIQLTDLGKIVEAEWLKTTRLRPDMNLDLLEYVVMPNHFHGVIYIGENLYNDESCRDAMHRVLTDQNGQGNTHFVFGAKNKFGSQSKNLASIIRGFKSAVTTYARKNEIEFSWQTRFHDRIISSGHEYERIAEYIIHNPVNWQRDKFYKQGG